MKTKDKIGIILVLLLIYLVTLPEPIFEPFLSEARIQEINRMTQMEYIERLSQLLDLNECTGADCEVLSPEEFAELTYLQEHPQSAETENDNDPGSSSTAADAR